MKECRTCENNIENTCFESSGGTFRCSNYKPKPKEHKITSEQINTLFITNKEYGDKLLKEWFPEEFKSKQEYCCVPFKFAIDYNVIKIRACLELWEFKSGQYLDFCPFCGEVPKPPIKST